jgi:hypothetical protein
MRSNRERSPNPRGGRWRSGAPKKRRPKPPTVKQIYALAAALCTFTEQEFPRTRGEATDLIERIRIDIGHPEPSLLERERD